MLNQNFENQENKLTGFENVGPTAWMVAYSRSFTDIPFSKEIFDKLEAIRQKSGQAFIPEDLKKPEIAPQFEARHKLIDRLILKSGIKQVLELASGFSSRGLSMAGDKNFNYVEIDLPGVMNEKKQVVKEIAADASLPIPQTLHFEEGNVLEKANLEKAARHFDKTQPIAVVNEGLLRYLAIPERAKVATHIHSLLIQFGGEWITSDISLKRVMREEDKAHSERTEKIAALTGKDIVANYFETEEAAQKFFKDLGFTIERHSFMEARPELSSPARLNLLEDQVTGIIKDPVVYVMRAV